MVEIPSAASVLALVPGMTYEAFARTIINQITTAANAGRREISVMNNVVKGNLVSDFVSGNARGDDVVSKLVKELRAQGYTVVGHREDYRDPRDYSPARLAISW